MSPYISIITLNINELKSPIERHRVAGWIEEQTICCLRRLISTPKTNRFKVRGWKMILQVNVNWKKAGIAILTSDKMDQAKNGNKKGNYVMNDKGSREQDANKVIHCAL